MVKEQIFSFCASFFWGLVGGLLYEMMMPAGKWKKRKEWFQILFWIVYTTITIPVLIFGAFSTLRAYHFLALLLGMRGVERLIRRSKKAHFKKNKKFPLSYQYKKA